MPRIYSTCLPIRTVFSSCSYTGVQLSKGYYMDVYVSGGNIGSRPFMRYQWRSFHRSLYILVLCVEMSLMLRLYALYGRSRLSNICLHSVHLQYGLTNGHLVLIILSSMFVGKHTNTTFTCVAKPSLTMVAETTVDRPLFWLSCIQLIGFIVRRHPQRFGIQAGVSEHNSLSLRLAYPGLLLPAHSCLVRRSLVSGVPISSVLPY